MRRFFIVTTLLLLLVPTIGAAQDYAKDRKRLAKQRAEMAKRFGAEEGGAALSEAQAAVVERELLGGVERLFTHWMGTRWALGAPQTQTPGEGKINCGMFVGTVLVHAGFEIDHVRLQRQPAELIVKSTAPTSKIRRFRHASMKEFLKGVRELGPGLYIIGLDFHVGFLVVQKDNSVRFVHASYVTHKVVDEPAKEAKPIIDSKYRVIGKILQKQMLEAWLDGDEIAVRGDW